MESKFRWGPRHPGQEGDGLVLLVPGVQAGCVFWGTQLGALIRESPGNLVRLVCGLAPSKNYNMEDDEIELIAQLLLESRTCAYIDWLDDNLIRLIIIHK